MLQQIKMKNLMSVQPVTLSPDTDIRAAVQQLLAHKISGATVVDSDNKVIGIVSEIDLLKAVEEIAYYDEGGDTVSEYMTTEVEVIDCETGIFEIADRLRSLGIRRLPVVENGIFVGQISARSVLQALQDSINKQDTSA